jgi:geranylgeranyl diphosphate synthase, type II
VTHFDLDEYLAARRVAIDGALQCYISAQPGHNHTVWRAMRYGLFPGGKRIRPVLTLAAGELFGGRHQELLPFACAIEMIHAYSLIHDDLPALDDDDLRRGAPTAHKVFGEGMALLAGDGLLTEAFCLLSAAEVRKSVAPDLLAELIHEIGCAVGVAGLVGGQAADLEAEEREVDLAAVEYVHVRKTGALIHAAVRVGARLAGATGAELRQVSRYGEYFGLAFQIADDVLDHQGEGPESHAESGRKERKKATYPSVVGMAQAKERLAELLQATVNQLTCFGSAAEPLRAIATQVVGRALSEEFISKIEETHP